jgi:hypothetical protein
VTRLRRQPRAVYRVYDEDEYLAGGDALAGWDAPPAPETKRGRRLQRLAGTAALTGAVGTVGGVIGFAGLRAHPDNRPEIAEHRAPSVRTVTPRTSRNVSGSRNVSVSAVRVTRRRHIAHLDRRPRISVGARPVEVALARTPQIARSVPEIPARAVAASAVQSAPAEAEARPRAQSEFGFER